MTCPDLERQELARDLAAFAAKAMREAALLAGVAVRITDESYDLGKAAGFMKRMTGRQGIGIMLANQLKPLAARAEALAGDGRKAAKSRRRIAQSSVEHDGIVFLSVRKPLPADNGDDFHPRGTG